MGQNGKCGKSGNHPSEKPARSLTTEAPPRPIHSAEALRLHILTERTLPPDFAQELCQRVPSCFCPTPSSPPGSLGTSHPNHRNRRQPEMNKPSECSRRAAFVSLVSFEVGPWRGVELRSAQWGRFGSRKGRKGSRVDVIPCLSWCLCVLSEAGVRNPSRAGGAQRCPWRVRGRQS